MAAALVDTFFKDEAPAKPANGHVGLGWVLDILKHDRDMYAAKLVVHQEAIQQHLQRAKAVENDAGQVQKRLDELNEAIAILGAAAGMTD